MKWLVVLLAWPVFGPHPAQAAQPDPASPALVARGAYLAKAADCAGCHTAALHGTPYAGGLGVASPFGTIYSSNITPDPQYGIGRYRYDDFKRALRHGTAPGGKQLYPAMPYASFSKVPDADMRALYAYFMHGVPPVAKPAPPTRLPFPFNQRWALVFWKLMFLPKGDDTPRPERDAQWNRGAYLVQSLGHCGACHTPRGLGYQERGYDESSRYYLSGGVNDHWYAANLRSDAGAGLGRLSEAEIADFLKTGHGGGIAAYGSMVETVEDSLQYLNQDDLHAIAHYLKSLPPKGSSASFHPESPQPTDSAIADPAKKPVSDPSVVGASIYASFCAQCHQANGSGVARVYPKLTGNPSVLSDDTASLIRLLIEGGNSPATIAGPPRRNMPSFVSQLSNVEIAQVLTFVRSSWGNDARPVSASDVASLRGKLHK